MGRRLSLLLSIAPVVALALAPGASAALHVANQRALKRVSRAATSESASGSLIAPLAACPQQENLGASAEAQQQAMRCMTDFARQRAGLAPLADSPQLDSSSQAKTADLLACDSFSHEACGRAFSYWIHEAGYTSASCWHIGENLAWGTGTAGTVRSIFRAWMRSPDHRRNVLGEYTELGVDVGTGELEAQAGARVWTAHFGSRCEAQA
ncbi:MAG TPA: CAP domain-containing protein [Solirubrobacterales bacterium]|nr:CAP domain-containing protein [Solirubrobacterales bacterium]